MAEAKENPPGTEHFLPSPARVPAPVWWHQGRGVSHAMGRGSAHRKCPRRNLPFPLRLRKCRTRELLIPGQSDSGSCVLTGTFDLGPVPGFVAPGTASLGCRMVLSSPCIWPCWLLGTPSFLPQLLPAPASTLWVLDWDFWDLLGMLGTFLGCWGQCGSWEWKGPDISSPCGVTGLIPWSIQWIRRCLMELVGWMSWHCPEGGLGRPMSSSRCGDSVAGNRTCRAGAGSGGAKRDVLVWSVPLKIPPGQRGLLGDGDDPKVEGHRHQWRLATIKGQWPQARNCGHHWRWMVVTDRE